MKKVNKNTWKKVCRRTDSEKETKDNTVKIITSDNPSPQVLRMIRALEKL